MLERWSDAAQTAASAVNQTANQRSVKKESDLRLSYLSPNGIAIRRILRSFRMVWTTVPLLSDDNPSV
jgi:hypothetical protein